MKASGKDWSVAGKPRQWVLSARRERSVEPQSWPVWSQRAVVYMASLVMSTTHQCTRDIACPPAGTSPWTNEVGRGIKGLCLEIHNGEEINAERL